MGNTPNVRFKGFTEDWEQRKLSEISDFITKGATPTTYGYDWQESGIPFFRNDAIKDNKFSYGDFSYISEEANEALQRSEIHGDDILVAITGDIGKAGIVPKSIEKGNINQHTARVRIIKDAIPYFVYQSLITDKQQKKYQLIKTGLSMPQLSLQQIRDTIILCPSVEEQSMIGECFINLDNLITLHQQKCDETKEFKKYMLQNMFPQKDEKVPKIRFDGFTGDWEQRKFADFTWDAGKRNKEDLDLEPYAITNEHGFIRQCDAHDDFGYMKDTDRKAYNIVRPNSFAYNPARINVGSIGYYKGMENVIVSSLYEVFQTDNDVSDRFLWHWFKSDEFPRWIERLQEGSVRLYFYYDKLCECQIYMPSLKEQEKIASFLDALDNLITLHQQKCNALKEFKKYMLQNMFPQKGENKCQN